MSVYHVARLSTQACTPRARRPSWNDASSNAASMREPPNSTVHPCGEAAALRIRRSGRKGARRRRDSRTSTAPMMSRQTAAAMIRGRMSKVDVDELRGAANGQVDDQEQDGPPAAEGDGTPSGRQPQ